jgi:hypothetical protein
MFLLPGIFMDAALRASGRIRFNDEPPPPVPQVLGPMVALRGRFADSDFGLAVALSVMGAGILLGLLGVARVFRPKQ